MISGEIKKNQDSNNEADWGDIIDENSQKKSTIRQGTLNVNLIE
jgi:hypothetical protein